MKDKVYVIAEIASAHEGDVELAWELYQLANKTGACAVKLQIFQRDCLLSKYHHMYDEFGKIEIKKQDWTALLAKAGGLTSDIIIEVFDESSLELSESSGVVTAYKIPTSNIGDKLFMKSVASTGKPIYLGVGGATMQEISSAVDYLKTIETGKLILMHGIQSFPTKLEDSQISLIHTLIDKYHLDVGYADHISAEETVLAVVLPAMAVAAGATVIEKHITIDRSKKGRDYFSSLEFLEFKSFVSKMGNMNVILGSQNNALLEAESVYRDLMKKQAVASKNLFVNDRVGFEDFEFKRTGIPGLSHEDISKIYGKKLKNNKNKDEPVILEDFHE